MNHFVVGGLRAVVAVVFLLVSTSTTVFAQPDSGGREAEQAAKKAYEEGSAHYDAGRYEEALQKFTVAYKLSGRADLLFNIASVHERLANYQGAADSLRDYIKQPNATDISSVQERIRRLEANAEKVKRRAEEELREDEQAKVVVGIEPAGQKSDDEGGSSALKWGLGGGAIVGLGVGAVFMVLANSDVTSVEDSIGRAGENGTADLTRAGASGLLDDASQKRTIGFVAIGAGAVLGIVAGIMFAADGDDRDSEVDPGRITIAPLINQHSGGLVFGGAF